MEIHVWNLFNEALKKRVGIASFNRWLSQLKPVKHHANKLVLVCPNKFVLDWVKLNYHNDLMTAFHQVTGEEVLVDFIAHSDNNGNGNNKETPSPSQLVLPGTERYLTGLPFINREYTFQNFIVGPGNQLAYASALAVTDKEPRLYNPLFFYSPEGLGKTHLSSAVGQKIYSTHPDVKVFYTTAEWFTHEMIQALRKNNILEFKEKYRKYCDVLVIEDIQFFQKKEKTQEEIFYTLDSLIQMGKQVVLTANSNPREISDLKTNLKSRMGSGLVVDIKPPDYETKRKIIARKCEEENVKITEDVADFIAQTIKSNIRDIKSAIIQLIAGSSLLGKSIDLDLAKETLRSFIQNKLVDVMDIQKFISRQFKVSPEQLKSKSRSRTINYPRQIAYYFCRKYTDSTLSTIGSFFNRNHSSVLRALNQFEISLRTNRGVKDAINLLTQQFEKIYF
ncbi:MAG TPA: chromosomal replication initiator protein DnaA [Thermodesulfobacteriota bacterium]|nr:chromosomal replication initiator protein DnaA [Thermodesulfobacteriota bacterium]